MSDWVIEQLLVQMNDFIIDEMGDDTHENMLLMLTENEAQDEAESSSHHKRKKIHIERGRDEGNERLVAEKEYHSGWSDDQIKERVRQIYYSRCKKQFRYEHAWEIIRKEPKWSGGSMEDGHAKRTKTTSSGSYTSSSDVQSSDVQTSIDVEDDDEVEFRPIGKKKALGKRKGKATTSNAEVNDSLRDLINQTNSLRMARIDEVNENIKDIKESYKSSKRIEEIKILSQSTQGLNEEQLAYHNLLCSEIKGKYGI